MHCFRLDLYTASRRHAMLTLAGLAAARAWHSATGIFHVFIMCAPETYTMYLVLSQLTRYQG